MLMLLQGKVDNPSTLTHPPTCTCIIHIVVVLPDQPAWRAIIGQFGVDVLLDDRTIDRKKLGSIIFDNEEQRRILNRITHPFIQKRMLMLLLKHFLKGIT